MTELTERETAILCVLRQRAEASNAGIKVQERRIAELEKEIAQRREQIVYYKAKRDGYEQAIELLNEPLESIKIELE